MITEPIVPSTTPHLNQPVSSFERYAWLFMRLSGAILMVMAVFHLLYMHFIIPGGVAAIDQSLIVARWTNPVWGVFWRTFDLLLLAFSLTHGGNGLRSIINDHIRSDSGRSLAKMALYLIYFVLAIMGVTIIFSFKSGG